MLKIIKNLSKARSVLLNKTTIENASKENETLTDYEKCKLAY